jgi:hypothetical protein
MFGFIGVLDMLENMMTSCSIGLDCGSRIERSFASVSADISLIEVQYLEIT